MLIAAILLALVAGVLPIVVSFYLSDVRAMRAERDHLSQYANWTMQRAQRNLISAMHTLKMIDGEGWSDCSAAHVDRMRALANETAAVESVGYIVNGHLACTGWGLVSPQPAMPLQAQPLADGFSVTLNAPATGFTGDAVLSIRRAAHVVEVRSERLVDVLRDTTMSLGVALVDGPVLALSGNVDPALVTLLIRGPIVGMNGTSIYASTVSDNLVSFAVSDRQIINDRVRHELHVLAPLGLLISGLLMGVVYWISRQRLSFAVEVATGIKKGEFVPYYQPIVSLQTGACVGAEALVRWQRPDGTCITPNTFIPVAESTGLIAPLTDLVIERVVADIHTIVAAHGDIHVAINISVADIESGRFLPVLGAALARHRVQASHVWLEATERGFINADAARETLCKARDLGHAVAIDDFGTGYSSLSLLEMLPLDALKIDKSFVDSIGKQAATSVVTPHIVGMANELNLTVAAEGIETREQEAYLREAGVQCGQGWLYGRAMPLQDFLKYLKSAG